MELGVARAHANKHHLYAWLPLSGDRPILKHLRWRPIDNEELNSRRCRQCMFQAQCAVFQAQFQTECAVFQADSAVFQAELLITHHSSLTTTHLYLLYRVQVPLRG